MRVAVVADLHANLPALRAVLDDAAKIGCDAIWCAGDVIGRGPHPNEVAELLRALDVPTVQGNWDEAVGMDREHSGALWPSHEAEELGALSLGWTKQAISDENRAWLRNLPTSQRFGVEGRSVLLFHGSPLKQTEYLWSDRPSRYFARIASDEADDLFCFGHTHESFHRVVGQGHFVAAGSVGCGLDGDARARYAVVYVGQPDIAVGFRSVDYDHASVVRDMAAAGLSIDLLRVAPAAHPLPATTPNLGLAPG
ncbi:MAG TPA: metallophosphoesterase family protein [Candidatus Limnocylindria bacterium]|nr:metallophosphoesterase family protein [Candidatus Limnocylindria bacterium]